MTRIAGRWNPRSTARQTRSASPAPRRRRALHVEALEGRALLSGPGSLDPTFNGTGIQTHSLRGAGWDGGNFVAVQTDGKTLVVGNTAGTKAGQGAIGITRFNLNGSIDTSFGSGGVVSVSEGADASAMGITIQPDGKILVCGTAWKSPTSASFVNQYLVVRLNSNGSLDSTFASKGKFVWDPTQYTEVAQSMAVLPDGSIVVGGKGSSLVPVGQANLLVYSYTAFKLTPQGKLVTTFGNKGEFRYNFGDQGGYMNAMAVAPNGDLILAGDRFIPNGDPRHAQGYRFAALVAVTPSGRLDAAFNGTGVLEVAPPSPSDALSTFGFADVAIQNGKILVAGGATISRYGLTGALDTGFGTGGTFTATDGTGFGSLAVEADGSIVAGGSRVYETYTDPEGNTVSHGEMSVAHLTANGTIDAGFGGLGTGFVYVRPDVDTGISDLVVGPGGKITACGPRYVIRLTAPAL